MPAAASKRLVQAAEAERKTLLRAHTRLTGERDRLARLHDCAANEVAGIEDRLRTLAQIVGDPEFARIPPVVPQMPSVAPTISGPEIRKAAVRVLLEQPKPFDPIHYGDWYALLVDSGHVIAGKNPKAVFLTQISRSPVVAKAPAAGTYTIYMGALGRLRKRVARLQGEMRELACVPADQFSVLGGDAIRRRLVADINRAGRELAEATELLGAGDAIELRQAA